MGAKNRLKRLESMANNSCFADVLSWVRAGRFFDELSPDEQERYCLYQYGEGIAKPPESVFPFYNLHFRLEYKPKPITPSEAAENVKDLDSYMKHRLEEYNSPEACEKRRQEYEELQEIGKKRREAFYAGIPMDTYPLPWG